jgi:hypothetical protein
VIVIRQNQLDSMLKAGQIEFENEMMAHSKEFSPRLTELLGDEKLRIAIRQAMDRAESYGFTYRGPIRLYIELMFLCGSDFDTDPQYAEIRKELSGTDDQMIRAERIWQGVVDYNSQVCGEKNINVVKAEEYLAEFAKSPIHFNESSFVETIVNEMTAAFPQKVDYIGKEGLKELIDSGRATAQKHELSSLRAEALIIILMFTFGRGCTKDPLYPWISRTLQDEQIKDSEARTKRLEKKARTWLDHVLARVHKGAQT